VRVVVQRVSAARVEVGGEVVGAIDHGLCAFVGAGLGDEEKDVVWCVEKVVGLRVFDDDAGKMSRALSDVGGGLLVVSQFTLFGDVSRGRRPSFDRAMPPGPAALLYERFIALARGRGIPVETGRFRAEMRVVLENDGPVTLVVDSRA
jgi:D-tyrosyl-tRNA(Tyr) deacylase